MDQIALLSSTQMCHKHLQKKIEFVQVNDLSSSPNNHLFYCTTCINQDLAFKGVNHLLVSEIIDDSETNIIQKWPPLNDYSVLEKLISLTGKLDTSKSIVHHINQYFTQLKEEFLRKVDLCEKKMINRALDLPLGKESILKQYQDISQIIKLRSILIEGEKKDMEAHEKCCRDFIMQIESQKEKNGELLSNLISQCDKKEQLINFEYPNIIKHSIFSFIDEIDFFNSQRSSTRLVNASISETNQSSNLCKIMKLVSNKSNFCSESFLSEFQNLLEKISPLLSNISFENVHIQDKNPFDFSTLSQQKFDLVSEFIEHHIQLEKNKEHSVSIKDTFEYQHFEQIIESNVNFMNNNLKAQMKAFLIDAYPLLKHVNLTNGILDRDKFDCYRLLTNAEVSDQYKLIKVRQALSEETQFNSSQTNTIKTQINYILSQYDNASEVLRKYPIFDLVKKKQMYPCQIKLMKTSWVDGDSRIVINQDKQVSINSLYNGFYKSNNFCINWINCVSDIILEKQRKYVFRFKIDHQRQNEFYFILGLMSNSNCDTDYGSSEYLSCWFFNKQNQIQYYEDLGISKQLKGDRIKISSENEIEMRVWLGGEQLEILDYPNYCYQIGLQDKYKEKLSTINDLKLYIGLSEEQIRVTLINSFTVDNFPN